MTNLEQYKVALNQLTDLYSEGDDMQICAKLDEADELWLKLTIAERLEVNNWCAQENEQHGT